MKNLKTFAEFVNESKVNEALATAADLKDGAVTLADRYAEIEGIMTKENLPDYCDIKALKKQYELLAKALRVSDDKAVIVDSESDAYDLVLAFNVGLDKRRKSGDANVKLVSEFTFTSPWDSRSPKINCKHYHIVDGKFDVITFTDGDDFSNFDYIVYNKAQEKTLLDWGNKNMTTADTEY
jgi:hypothetical protein